MKHFCSFSEAIREGSKLNPQGFFALEHQGKTCAIGAALSAIGYADIGEAWPSAAEMYPYLSTRAGRDCPVVECEEFHLRIYGVIAHLNDEHRWTREAIADWLEREEEKLGYVTVVESETSALNTPEAGRGDSGVNTASSLQHESNFSSIG